MPRPSHSSRFDHPKKLGEEYRSLSSSLFSFLHSPVTSSLLGPNILFNNLIDFIKKVNINTAFSSFIVKHYKGLVLSLCTYYCDDMFLPYIGHHQVLVHYVRSVFIR
jgi:hypothetical protein